VKTAAATVIIANPTSWSLPVACQHQTKSPSVILSRGQELKYGNKNIILCSFSCVDVQNDSISTHNLKPAITVILTNVNFP